MNAKHVLIVEDNPHLRRILAGALEYHGYTVSEAATGEEAIVMAINENPKLILLDLTLPDMSGTEAARALSKIRRPHIFQLLVAAHTSGRNGATKRCAPVWLAMSKSRCLYKKSKRLSSNSSCWKDKNII